MIKGSYGDFFGLRLRLILVTLSALAAALFAGRPASAANHLLGFEGLPEEIRGGPGDVVTFDAFITLTTSDNETPDGPQGWSYAVALSGPGRITQISVDGIKVSTIYVEDPDQSPETPNIVHDPYEVDLGKIKADRTGTMITLLCDGTRDGESLGKVAASLNVLRLLEKMVLQPNGTQRIARITVEAKVPEGEGCSPLTLYVLNDGQVTCPVGCGGPHAVITEHGGSLHPDLGTLAGQVCVTSFRRGDGNGDGRVDISDAIFALNFMFLGGSEPRCKDAVDANDDDGLDITDCVLILNRLFSRDASTVVPPPGIYSCGPDQAADRLSCSESSGC